MKFKKHLIALLFSLFLFGNCFAEELNFDFKISLIQNIFWAKDENIIAKVMITNKSEQTLDISKLSKVEFYLSKCSKIHSCSDPESNFISSVSIESKFLKKGELVEFNIYLADLYWVGATSKSFDMTYPKNLYKVPIFNKYFYGVIRVFEKKLEVKDYYSKNLEAKDYYSKIPLSKSYFSNEIVQKTKPE